MIRLVGYALALTCLLYQPAYAAVQKGIASVYCDKHVAWHSARMNCKALTVAHRTLKFGTHVKITYKARSIEAVVTDRGPYVRGRIIDLSTGAAKALHLPGLGRVTVAVTGGSHGISIPRALSAGPVRVDAAAEPAQAIVKIARFGVPELSLPPVVDDMVTEPLPKINRQSVASPEAADDAERISEWNATHKQEAPMDWADWLMKGFALFGAASVAWYVGKYGLSALGTKVSGAFSVAKADFVALEARVKSIEGHPALQIPPLPNPVPAQVAAAVAAK